MTADLHTPGVLVPIADGEAILRREEREVGILAAHEEITITHARYSGGQIVAGPHVHHRHTDAFYVLEGELTFEVGREAETVTVGSDGFLAAPPEVAHSFGTRGDRPARWLTIHADDGGFGAFMRGVRDGVEVEWDIAPVPADGGLPASTAIVSPGLGGGSPGWGDRLCRLRCALPDLCVAEWRLRGPRSGLSFPLHGRPADLLFVIEGELEAMLGGVRETVGPGTLVAAPAGVEHAHGSRPARVLSFHTPSPLERPPAMLATQLATAN